MVRRNAGPLFEGHDRRVEKRRLADRRKSARIFLVLKYLAVAILAAVLARILM